MNNIVILASLFGLMTIGTASILYSSFKGQKDISARYFLLAELVMLPALLLVILVNLDIHFYKPLYFFITNSLGFISEIAIIFSIYALTKSTDIKKFFAAVFGVMIFCALIELARYEVNPKFPILMVSLASSTFAFVTYRICRSLKSPELHGNQFLKWFGNLEIGLGLFALIRIGSYFSETPVSTLNPAPIVSLLYTVFVALSIFRYIAYHSLRISWVGQKSSSKNSLNTSLAKALEEKDQLLRSLITSNRVLGISALANSLAHQLSQPLTGIALQTETIKRNLAESNQHESSVNSLNKISRQLGKLSELVKNLRQLFSSKDNELIAINLQEVADGILEIVEPTLNEKKIILVKHYNSSVNVSGDAIQIQQVLINIFNNAIDSIVSTSILRREIVLCISQKDGFGVITITDSGKGINEDLLSQIFTLYKTTKKDGLGVGLWLSKTIIDKHHGTLSASNSKDGGATFEIQIPLAKSNG